MAVRPGQKTGETSREVPPDQLAPLRHVEELNRELDELGGEVDDRRPDGPASIWPPPRRLAATMAVVPAFAMVSRHLASFSSASPCRVGCWSPDPSSGPGQTRHDLAKTTATQGVSPCVAA